MDRYKVFDWFQVIAALATFVAVMFAYQTLRSADKQISIAKEQVTIAQREVQPSFNIAMKVGSLRTRTRTDTLGRTSKLLWDVNKNGIPDTLTLKISGSADNVAIDVASSVVFRSPTDPNLYDLVPTYFWERRGKNVAEFVASPPESSIKFDPDEEWYDIISIMRIEYEDVFHQLQRRYFLVPAPVPANVQSPYSMTDATGTSCLALLEGSSPLIRMGPVADIDTFIDDHEWSLKELERYSFRAPAAPVRSCFSRAGFL